MFSSLEKSDILNSRKGKEGRNKLWKTLGERKTILL